MRLLIPIEVLQTQQAWSEVGAIFQDGNHACDECPHSVHDIAAPQFGDAPVGDIECGLGQRRSDRPSDCPVYAERLNQKPTEESLQ
jgi:hypothetical protein